MWSIKDATADEGLGVYLDEKVWRIRSGGARIFAAFIMLAGLMVTSAQEPVALSKDVFATNAQSISLPFELREGLVFVRLRVNGSTPLLFNLDTGSTRTLIDRDLAASLGMKAEGSGSLQGAGAGRIPIQSIHGVSIELSGLRSAGYEFSTADLKPLETNLKVKVDGLLGYEFFTRFVVTIDYAANTLTIASPGAAHPQGEALPLEIRAKWPRVRGELLMPGEAVVEDSFLIDLGSSDAVDHPIVKQMKSRVATTTGVGLGRPGAGDLVRATYFRLGKYSLAGPLVACCGSTEDNSRLIGSEILRRFTVTFDYPDSKIYLKPNASLAEPFVATP